MWSSTANEAEYQLIPGFVSESMYFRSYGRRCSTPDRPDTRDSLGGPTWSKAERRWRSGVATTSLRGATQARNRIWIPGWHTQTPAIL